MDLAQFEGGLSESKDRLSEVQAANCSAVAGYPSGNEVKTPGRAYARSLARQATLMEMYRQGKNLAECAQSLGVGIRTITRDLTYLRCHWRVEAGAAFGDYIDRELARLDAIESEAWEAWERSQEDDVVVKEAHNVQLNLFEPVERMTRKQSGNPAFLQAIMKCIDARIRLLELAETAKTRTGGGVQPTFRLDVPTWLKDRQEQTQKALEQAS